MKKSLQQHLERLNEHRIHNAYMLHGADIDPRACCKSLREKIKRLLPTVEHHAVWIRVGQGVLLLVSGPEVVASVLSSHLSYYEVGGFTETKLYSGIGKKVIGDLVQSAFSSRYVPTAQRSFGASSLYTRSVCNEGCSPAVIKGTT